MTGSLSLTAQILHIETRNRVYTHNTKYEHCI